jgi:hypothetical protein
MYQKKIKIIITVMILLLLRPLIADAAYPETGVGFYTGLAPAMGGSMNTYVQNTTLGVGSGIDSINREMSGRDTEEIDRLLGVVGGFEGKVIVLNYFMIRLGANYIKSFIGGTGKTLDLSDELVTVKYSMWACDFPLTVGLSLPFWKDVRISLSGGIAYAYGSQSSSFKSVTLDQSTSVKGWAIPLVFIMAGEHYLTNTLSLTSTISYYKGASRVKGDNGSDYGRVDFTGYRWTIGCFFSFNPGEDEKK